MQSEALRLLISLIVLVALCAGCAGFRDARLEDHQQALATTFQDDKRPMDVRMAAFDDLLATFTSGTREAVLDRFLGSSAVSKSRIDGIVTDVGVYIPGNTFSLSLVAPDGSSRWITMEGDRVQ